MQDTSVVLFGNQNGLDPLQVLELIRARKSGFSSKTCMCNLLSGPDLNAFYGAVS